MRAVRSFPRAVVVLALLLATAMVSSAQADPAPSLNDINAELVRLRIELNALQVNAATAGEAYNQAMVDAAAAQVQADQAQQRAEGVQESLDQSTSDLATLTVDRMLNNTQAQAVSALLNSQSPETLLDQAVAYDQTQAIFNSEVISYQAQKTVADVVLDSAADSAKASQDALDAAATAQQQVDQAVADAEARQSELMSRREALIQQAAQLQGISVTQATANQDAIDRQIDLESTGAGSSRSVLTPGAPDTPTTTPTTTTPVAPTAPTAPTPTTAPTAPTGSSTTVEPAIGYALAQVGKPYQWGGAGPNAFDCSGLTMRALQAGGRSVSRTAGAQYYALTAISPSQMRRGDLLFWSSGGSIYHVAIYLGNGQMVHAPNPSRPVEVVSVNYWIPPDLAARP